jgi:pimeloyl-ACP methyl ester carboxylesterase
VSPPSIERAFVPTRSGTIHVASAGAGEPVLLLHQTPRSWDEFRDVLPLLGRRYRTIAMDTLGFGDSDKPAARGSIERYAEAVIALMDALSLDRTHLVGHHTGGVIAVEVAAAVPERIQRLVLSATACVDAARRARNPTPTVDEVAFSPDGSHLTRLWQRRMPYYPPDRPDLLHRLVLDAMKVLDRVEEGHVVVGEYHMEDRLPLIRCPVLIMCGTEDWAAAPGQERLAGYLPQAQLMWIPGAGVPMDEEVPDLFAAVVSGFLAGEPLIAPDGQATTPSAS